MEFKVFQEHYYNPILFKKDSDNFQHIIKEKSEIEFLEELKIYLDKEDNNLDKFDWWYFSKIDQSVDNIGLPYFDSEAGEYRTFFPDFIFWLGKGDKYYLKFIDPHGVQFIGNSSEKIDGFNDFAAELSNLKHKNKISAEMYFYNKNNVPHGVEDFYRKYFTSDLQEMFAI